MSGFIKYIVMSLLVFMTLASSALAIELKTAAQDSAPKYFKLKNGKMGGLCVDIMQAIEKIDPEIKFVGHETFLPFKRMAQQLENGDIHVFFGFVKNKSREEKYNFVNIPLYQVNHVVAIRSDDNVDVKSFDDIRALGNDGKILTIFGTSTYRYLNKQGGLQIDDGGKNIPAVLKMLLLKRGRFAYYHNLGLATSIRNEGLQDKVKILPTSFREYYQYAAFSKKIPQETVVEVEKALKKLSASGELARILDKYIILK